MPAGSPLLFLTHYHCAVDDLREYCTKSISSLFQISLLLCTAFPLEVVSVSAAVLWEKSSWNVFTRKTCQLAQPESVARIIIVTGRRTQLNRQRRYNSKWHRFNRFLPSTNLHPLQKKQSDMFLAHLENHANECPRCAEFIPRAKYLGGQAEAFLPKHVHPVRRKNTHYHSTTGPTLGANN